MRCRRSRPHGYCNVRGRAVGLLNLRGIKMDASAVSRVSPTLYFLSLRVSSPLRVPFSSLTPHSIVSFLHIFSMIGFALAVSAATLAPLAQASPAKFFRRDEPQTSPSGWTGKPVISGYWPSYQSELLKPNEIPYDMYTHIVSSNRHHKF